MFPTKAVLGVELSPEGKQVVLAADRLLQSFDLDLELVHVDVLLEHDLLQGEELERLGQLVELRRQRFTRDFEVQRKGRAQPVGLRVIRGVNAAKGLVEEALAIDADLIIVGSHQRHGLSHLTLGSVAEQVNRLSHVPVLTVPMCLASSIALQRVVVAIDFSDVSFDALASAADWARRLQVPLHLVHVLEPIMVLDPVGLGLDLATLDQRRLDEAEKRMKAIVSDIDDIELTYELRSGSAAAEILDALGDAEHQLVVMGRRGWTGVERFLFGSVTQRVLRRSPAPLLVIEEQRV